MKTIAVDFDGVINKYSKGWHDGTIYDDLIEGSIESIKKIMKDFYVYIFTARDSKEVHDWLKKQNIGIPLEILPNTYEGFWDKQGILGITNRKIPAVRYVDDRAIHFEGEWSEDILNKIYASKQDSRKKK